MLTDKQVEEIRDHLEKAQNPVFLYDNDADGLCSFLLFRRFIGRGKGVAVRSYPDLNSQYAKRCQELNADYVFILDKALISREFVEELDKMQIPVVWLDHHSVSDDKYDEEFNHFYTYNPTRNKNKSEEPVTYLAYHVTQRKEDVWIAIMGCIADHYLPDFASEFEKKYPDYWGKVKKPFDAYYRTEIGKIAQALNFGLKDSTSHIVEFQNFLLKCKNPGEILAESSGNESFRNRYEDIKKKYTKFVKEASENVSGDLVFFQYGGDLSISADIANEVSYNHPGKYICIAYLKGPITNISLRGKGVKKILKTILDKIENSHGGGHEDAVGARIRTEDLVMFKKYLEEELK